MDNKGRIVVFMSLMTSVFMILITVVFQVVIQSAAKSKTVIASRLSTSDIKACYNNYIFEHYHILLFDKTMGGKGEAYVENLLQTFFDEKLGDEYEKKEVGITGFYMLEANTCAAFREQIQEYMVYALADEAIQTGVDTIHEKMDGQDGTLPDSLEDDMDQAQSQSEQGARADTEEPREDSPTEDAETEESHAEAEDPRDYTKKLSSSAILELVMPEDKTASTAAAQLIDAPSRARGTDDGYEEVERDFSSMSAMKEGLKALGSWSDKLVDTGSQAAYAQMVFNSFMEEKNDTAVLKYEQEYLIAGKSSDYENLKSVAHRMIGIRFPMNYISLCAQADKMAQLYSLASTLSAAAPYLIPLVKYLLAGCWAYVESIADVKVLFHGKKAAAIKTSENWITDIEHIGDSLDQDVEEVEAGLDYQAYLTILQLMNKERTMYRMLDLIQLNTMQEQENFRIKNAAVGFEADFEGVFQGHTYDYHQTAEY